MVDTHFLNQTEVLFVSTSIIERVRTLTHVPRQRYNEATLDKVIQELKNLFTSYNKMNGFQFNVQEHLTRTMIFNLVTKFPELTGYYKNSNGLIQSDNKGRTD